MSEQATETPEVVEPQTDTLDTDVTDNDGDESATKALIAQRREIKELKATLAKITKQSEAQRLESMSEAERAVEEAKKAGYDEAMSSVRRDLTTAKVTAAAAKAGFADPGDAAGFLALDDLDGDDAIAAAVDALVKAKPYLLAKRTPPIEQGQQGKPGEQAPTDWLRGVLA